MSVATRYEIWWRRPTIINTDPQRRCYNRCNFSEKEEWTEWQCLYGLATLTEAEASIASYQAINRTWQYKAIDRLTR